MKTLNHSVTALRGPSGAVPVGIVRGELVQLTATDLSNHLACAHRTVLDLAAAEGRLKPDFRPSPDLELLAERGMLHERAYLEHLAAQGLRVVSLAGVDEVDATRDAMRGGADVISQAPLASGRWHGRADVLRKIQWPSELGAWSYEVQDTKLARETRGGTILQLCLYTDLVGELQGVVPEFMRVVPPTDGFAPDSHRFEEYSAYYRLTRRRLEEAVEIGGDIDACPDPVALCETCRWFPRCDDRRRGVDHLSFVAGIAKHQMRELRDHDVVTLEALATHPVPLEWKPERGAATGYERVAHQARVQREGRARMTPVHELLAFEAARGLGRLPSQSPGDLFLDLEGDPFVPGGGREYLFGFAVAGEPYWSAWAMDAATECSAFEGVVDEIMARWRRDPGLHVYHFAPYEPAALKRLMGRYATRESEIDSMLRAELFVDLHAVVRQALRASVERYSVKDLEVFYGFEREEDLAESSANRRMIERAIEVGPADLVTGEVRDSVERYNRDDCVSAMKLRDWLEALRAEAVVAGETIERPEAQPPDASEKVSERSEQVAVLMERLTEGIPDEPSDRSAEQNAQWLLAHMLDWHRREEKVAWWEYFRLRDLDDEALLDERKAIAGLEFVSREGGKERYPIHRYRFPKQDTGIREGKDLHSRDMEGIGEVVAFDVAARTVDIKKSGKAAGLHPTSVIVSEVFPNAVAAKSLLSLGEWVAENGIDAPGPRRAARNLLLRRPPRCADAGLTPTATVDSVALARRIVTTLDGEVLPIQGPPGSGKTYTGARMIVELVRAGRRVGVSATSHKVILNLLEAAIEAAAEEKVAIACARKPGKGDDTETAGIVRVEDNPGARAFLDPSGTVLGGTTFMWSRPEFFESVDVLIVDEAGQVSLADVLAIAHAANSVVLLGDPQQLDQPIQGSHPEGTEVSALEHLLAGARTITADRGIFLAETRRLAPALCEFTSEAFYEGRLAPLAGLEAQEIRGATPFAGAGLWFVPVEHEGNRNASAEEVDAIGELVHALTSGNLIWVHADDGEMPLTRDDVLVVAPYNAQVSDLASRLPGVRVGTVDKFQGQEAAIVIYSLTSSSPDDAPRGMEFLYDLNRLNVATSRARCACIVVGSPRLFEPNCQSPRQMRLANALCRYLEMAREVDLSGAGARK